MATLPACTSLTYKVRVPLDLTACLCARVQKPFALKALCLIFRRQQITRNLAKDDLFLEVELAHVAQYDPILQDCLLQSPNEYLPVVRAVRPLQFEALAWASRRCRALHFKHVHMFAV